MPPAATTVTGLARARALFRAVRRTRPFWAGVWMLLSGLWIAHYSFAPMRELLSSGFSGMGGLLTGGGLVVLALVVWAAPSQHILVGILGIFLALASLVASNLGGFFIGMLLGVLGGSMALAWGRTKPRTTGDSVESTRPDGTQRA